MKRFTTLNDANDWLVKNGHSDRYQILEWKFGNEKSKFFDKERRVHFEYLFTQFKNKLKNDRQYLFNPSEEEKREKEAQVFMKKYGFKSPLQNEEIKRRIKQTNLEKYGAENPSQAESVKQKKRETLLKNYGVESPAHSPEILMKRMAAYRKTRPKKPEKIKLTRAEVLEKTKKTLFEKYGTTNIMHVEEFRKKHTQTKIKNGTLKLYDGFLMKDLAKIHGISQSGVAQRIKKHGYDSDAAWAKNRTTSIEKAIQNILKELDVKFLSVRKKIDKFIPDFILPDSNIIIECDGLYWHSDRFLDKDYHLNKKKCYQDNGYTPLFFREDEILKKLDIVKSIIKNKTHSGNISLYARKCVVVEVSTKESKEFFELNHLMGPGSGRTYGLKFDGKLVSAIQVKWKNKDDKILEVSRFCSILNHSVNGGFSKLLSHVLKVESPDVVATFIDERYGDGKYLVNFGFKMLSSYPSFHWTDNFRRIHRMNFKGNSGYESGLYKIWDCGQAKWELDCKERKRG